MLVYTDSQLSQNIRTTPLHAWVYVFTSCVSCRSPLRSDENWTYRQLWADIWVLRTEPGSSARAVSALNCWAIVPDANFLLYTYDFLCPHQLRLFLNTNNNNNNNNVFLAFHISQVTILKIVTNMAFSVHYYVVYPFLSLTLCVFITLEIMKIWAPVITADNYAH